MKNWRAAVVLAAACVAALLSSLLTALVLSSAFVPVDGWFTAVAHAWEVPVLRRRWTQTRRRLWRRVDAALRGDATGSAWHDEVADEFASHDGDSDSDDEDDHCLGYLKDWKHGHFCLISR